MQISVGLGARMNLREGVLLALGVNVLDGNVTNVGVAAAHGLTFRALPDATG